MPYPGPDMALGYERSIELLGMVLSYHKGKDLVLFLRLCS